MYESWLFYFKQHKLSEEVKFKLTKSKTYMYRYIDKLTLLIY